MTRALPLALGLCWFSLFSCVVENRKYDEELAAERANEGAAAATGSSVSSSTDAGPDLCPEYCATVMSSCADCPENDKDCAPDKLLGKAKGQGFKAYKTAEGCLATCRLLSAGPDPVGNTVACRLQQAQNAKTIGESFNVHCSGASPGGGSTPKASCGSNCETYCDLYEKVCEEKYPMNLSHEVCVARCAGLPEDPYFDWESQHDNNTVQCRIVHLTSATLAPEVHCPHSTLFAKPLSDLSLKNNCQTFSEEELSCDSYCKVMQATCIGENEEYADLNDCKKTCEAFEKGTKGFGDTHEDSRGCRVYHSYASLQAPETHCSHAGALGDGHCGPDNCATYCKLAPKACKDEFTEVYGTEAKCLAGCMRVPGAAADKLDEVTDAKDKLRCRVTALVHTFGGKNECAAALGQAEPCK